VSIESGILRWKGNEYEPLGTTDRVQLALTSPSAPIDRSKSGLGVRPRAKAEQRLCGVPVSYQGTSVIGARNYSLLNNLELEAPRVLKLHHGIPA
jgi:hypothetical protein